MTVSVCHGMLVRCPYQCQTSVDTLKYAIKVFFFSYFTKKKDKVTELYDDGAKMYLQWDLKHKISDAVGKAQDGMLGNFNF